MSRPTFFLLPLIALLIGFTAALWWWPNQHVAAALPMPDARFNSLSFAPFRAGQSPLTGRFPTSTEVAQDITLLAPGTRALRTYAAIEGDYDVAALAQAAGLKLWQGIWLGADRAQNTREIDRAIEIAHRYPNTVERVVVGNEVLLRRDLPVDELTADIDHVKSAIHQPVTYADVWEFWLRFPTVADHVDIITIHLLPYWEDQPTGIDRAIDHVRDIYRRVANQFPGKPIAIGETGWPSRGRWRQDAAPTRVNQVIYLRRFIALADRLGFDYNLIEAFDQIWKYESEGIVGANWGLWDAARRAKFSLNGAIVEDPEWPREAAISVGIALLFLAAILFATPRLAAAMQLRLTILAFLFGNAIGYAWATITPDLYDLHLVLAANANLLGQSVLGWLLLRRAADRLTGLQLPPHRSGADATRTIRDLLTLRFTALGSAPAWIFDDLSFLFAWTAGLLQLLLVFDPRYRDFPIAAFAIPVIAVLARAWLGDLPRGGGGRQELCLGAVLIVGAVASAAQEGVANLQSLVWNGCALLLAAPLVLSFVPRRVAA